MSKLKFLLLSVVLLLSSLSFSTDIKSTTTVIDPVGNVTTKVYFGAYPFSVTEKKNGSTLLSTTDMCYNGAAHPCGLSTVTQPVAQKDIYVTLNGMNPSRVNTTYNSYGLPLDNKVYNYGPALVYEQVFTYGSLANPNIQDAVTDITTKDHSGTIVARNTNTYNGSGRQLTKSMLVTGSTFLTETFTYTSKGMISTSTGVNGAQTVYSNSACGGTEPSSVTLPLVGTESISWDCSGAVPTRITDANSNAYTLAYSDPFYRPTLGTDAAGTAIKYTYTPKTQQITGPLTQDLTTYNGAGKPIVTQIKNGGQYDTTSQEFDSLGRKVRSALPCVSGRSVPCSSTQITASYDSGGQPTTVLTDSLGGVVTTTYSLGDKTVVVSPAPTGENTKGKQFEYDALGRMTSVCEISNAAGSSDCGQRKAATGFVTTYTYDDVGNITTITQGAQTRSSTFDDLGRMLTTTQPESGTTTYTYDTSSCGTTSNGSLVKKVDANGNTSCLTYDAASRLTSITYSGPNATDSVFYVYDTATVNSVPMQNGKGRLVETYTCTSCPGTKKSDIGLSYNSVGQVTDEYESTTNSGGYYHLSLSLYSNQSLSSFTLTPAVIPTISYGVDAEGRASSVLAGSAALVSNTTRGPSNQINNITFGNGDTDVYGYDGDLRMSQFAFSVGGNSITGTVTHNANGTISSKRISDPFTSSTNETCAYTYDSWIRMSTANCSNFNSTYDYDRYGNMSKTGTTSFTPTYSATTNRMTAIGVVTPTYDANGNILTDGTSTYTWDAEGRMLSGPGVDSITYNGMGQMAEQTRGSAHQQLIYFPSGELLALMDGQSLNLAYVPLPNGSPAVYNSSGLAFFTHPDNTGSVRVTTTSARTLFSDLSYTPFGEKYNDSIAPGTISPVLFFAGHNQTTIDGLYDTSTRKYNPLQGRWVSADVNSRPAGGDPQTFNLYSYAMNNPLSLSDPSGAGDDPLGDPTDTSALPLGWDEGVQTSDADPNRVIDYAANYGNATAEEASLVYNAGEPAGGAGGSYSTLDVTLNTLGQVDPLGLSAGELNAVPEFLSYANKLARGAFLGPYEGTQNVILRLARSLERFTGSGPNSLNGVVGLTNKVLDKYGSLFNGPSLALGLTNPNQTREEVNVAIEAVGGRYNYRSGLTGFAESIGAKTYGEFSVDRSLGLQEGIHDLMSRVIDEGGTIHFNLDGLEDIPGCVAGTCKRGTLVEVLGEKTIFGNPRTIRVPFNSGHTVYELRYLKQNWIKFEPHTFFYRNGQIILGAIPGAKSYVPW